MGGLGIVLLIDLAISEGIHSLIILNEIYIYLAKYWNDP